MSENIKEIIKAEYQKCYADPVYFMKKYVWIQHPTRGRTQFNLYPFQEKVLKLFQKHDYSIVLKSRQLGLSTLTSGYTLWLMLFHKDKNILCIATKQDTAKNMVTKVKFAYDNLPNWLKIKTVENNKLSLKFINGSQVKAVSAAADAGRSEAVSLLLLDECAFIENIDEIFASAQQTLGTGGGCIALSTPNGTGNWFHRTWVKAENSENQFLPIKLPWTVHPERNQSWRDQQDQLLGARMAAQECDTEFNTSGDTVFEPDLLNFFEETWVKEPLERRGVDGSLWIWEQPDFSRTYMVCADVARGDGGDFSAFHIIDLETATQVAEFRSQIGTKEYGNLLVAISTEYNDALLVVENANIGWAVIQQIQERGYRNLYYSSKSDMILTAEQFNSNYNNDSSMVPGFTTSLKTRPLIISKMSGFFLERSCLFQSRRLLDELRTFVWKNGKAEAQSGYNDDLIMSWGIGLFIRDTALRYRTQNLELTKAALGSYTRTTSNASFSVPGVYSNSDRWTMVVGKGEKENLDWLL